jgi:hypothetical protein
MSKTSLRVHPSLRDGFTFWKSGALFSKIHFLRKITWKNF